jgi:hypothetical protein
MTLAQPLSAFRLQPSPIGASSDPILRLCSRKGYWKGESQANGNCRDERRQSGGMRRFSALRLLGAEMAQLELCLEARFDRVVLRLASWS